jgi:molybdopterin-guanine dinucleotide biosynthesis protein A
MGRDKATLVLGGAPLWQRQLATLRALEPAELLISGPLDGPWRGVEVRAIPDARPGLGPLGGLVTVLVQMRCERVLVLAIDLPAMTPTFLHTLLARCPADRGLVPQIEERFEPLAAIYPRAIHSVAERCLASGERSMQHFIRTGLAENLLVPHRIAASDRPLFHNVNRPDDLATRIADG